MGKKFDLKWYMGWNSREFIINNLKEDMDKKELKIDEEEFELEEEVED